MKRTLAVLAVAGIVLGGGAVAYAQASGGSTPAPPGAAASDPTTRQQVKDCITKARADHPGDRAAVVAETKDCLQKAGIDPTKVAGRLKRLAALKGLKAVRDQVKALPADKKAALKDCVKTARTAHQGDPNARRDAVKACLTQAGITLPPPAS
ncbi:MAG: hypothetical protein ABR511_13265 [Acidimicrobiales bacterium]